MYVPPDSVAKFLSKFSPNIRVVEIVATKNETLGRDRVETRRTKVRDTQK